MRLSLAIFLLCWLEPSFGERKSWMAEEAIRLADHVRIRRSPHSHHSHHRHGSPIPQSPFQPGFHGSPFQPIFGNPHLHQTQLQPIFGNPHHHQGQFQPIFGNPHHQQSQFQPIFGNPHHGSQFQPGPHFHQPIDGSFDPRLPDPPCLWTAWSQCDAACNGGSAWRARRITKECLAGPDHQLKACNTQPCGDLADAFLSQPTQHLPAAPPQRRTFVQPTPRQANLARQGRAPQPSHRTIFGDQRIPPAPTHPLQPSPALQRQAPPPEPIGSPVRRPSYGQSRPRQPLPTRSNPPPPQPAPEPLPRPNPLPRPSSYGQPRPRQSQPQPTPSRSNRFVPINPLGRDSSDPAPSNFKFFPNGN